MILLVFNYCAMSRIKSSALKKQLLLLGHSYCTLSAYYSENLQGETKSRILERALRILVAIPLVRTAVCKQSWGCRSLTVTSYALRCGRGPGQVSVRETPGTKSDFCAYGAASCGLMHLPGQNATGVLLKSRPRGRTFRLGAMHATVRRQNSI